MEVIYQYHEVVATFLARIFLGCLFFFQGYDAVFRIKIKNIIHTYHNSFSTNGIPKLFTICGSWFTTCSAFIGGCFLIAGIFQYLTLFVLGLNLIITAIGFGINTAM